ncbi:hypothetical protein I6M96_19220 [Acinetobacter seifertii]|uniref:fimbrial biogenesis chaperone n=1 Tax=Acinetobacter seifertii TaxID=1530123 RepID=UPI0018FFB66E|nr:hypothetical protein [Acinetobacter seifertii]MBJ8507110.1 hypothetical protein [Acinetobacter seifertii]
MNTQIKIFYRPSGLKKIDISSLDNLLNFNLKIENRNFKIICSNPTSYHASLTGIQISNRDKVFNNANELDLMSYPKSERVYLILGKLPLNSSYLLDFSLVDDNGVKHNLKKMINLTSN